MPSSVVYAPASVSPPAASPPPSSAPSSSPAGPRKALSSSHSACLASPCASHSRRVSSAPAPQRAPASQGTPYATVGKGRLGAREITLEATSPVRDRRGGKVGRGHAQDAVLIAMAHLERPHQLGRVLVAVAGEPQTYHL